MMAAYVLVHGGGHGGWCYRPLARLLRAKGHEVYTPTLTGLGEREHLLSLDVDLNLHITDVVSLLEFEDLRDVILVGHSYGGTVITGVADRTADRIRDLVYLDAPMPQNGQSLADAAGPGMQLARKQGRIVDGIELVLWPSADQLDLYGVTDPAQRAWMMPRLRPHPWKCFEQKLDLHNEAELRRIPISVIVCSSRVDEQSRSVLKAASEGRYWEIDTGHDLMITEPAAVADMLLALA